MSNATQEVEIALAEEAFQKDKAQLADLWAQRTHQFQQAVDLQVLSAKELSLPAAQVFVSAWPTLWQLHAAPFPLQVTNADCAAAYNDCLKCQLLV